MRDARRDIDEVALCDMVQMLEVRPVPERGTALEHVDRRLVVLVVVRLRLGARRHHEEVHADALRARALRRNAHEVIEPLLAVIAPGAAAADHLALLHGRFPSTIVATLSTTRAPLNPNAPATSPAAMPGTLP